MFYKIRQSGLLILMLIVNIIYNVIMLCFHIIVFIPSIFIRLGDYNKIHDMLYNSVPEIPEYKKEKYDEES